MDGAAELDVVVVGGGQAGLATGYHLKESGLRFVILEANERIGDSWRRRWESLRLFTPAPYDGLPGMPFPGTVVNFPTKDELADYLEAYASHHALPIRLGVRVRHVTCDGDRYTIDCGDLRFVTSDVVIATGGQRLPVVPSFAKDLDPAIMQLHSSAYTYPRELGGGSVLVVGAGTSGAEIALELAQTGHQTWLAGRAVGHIPDRAYTFGGRPFWFFANYVASRRHPIGRRLLNRMASRGAPLIRITRTQIVSAGVEMVPRVAGVSDGRPRLADGRVLQPASVVWCTGFRQDLTCLDPGLRNAEGVHLIGMPFQHKLASGLIGGVGSDAQHLVRQIRRARLGTRADQPLLAHRDSASSSSRRISGEGT